jgi:hypothetical protein
MYSLPTTIISGSALAGRRSRQGEPKQSEAAMIIFIFISISLARLKREARQDSGRFAILP